MSMLNPAPRKQAIAESPKFVAPEGVTPDASIPSMTILNWSGDFCFTWTPDKEKEVLEMVRGLMAQQYVFFVVKPRFLCFGSKRERLTNIEQLKNAKGLDVPDEAVEAFVAARASRKGIDNQTVSAMLAKGAIEAVRHSGETAQSYAMATTAEEVVRSHTVATLPVFGG